jgi:hypothetical protein
MNKRFFKRRTEAEQYLAEQGYQRISRADVWVSENGLIDAVIVSNFDEHGAQSFHLEYRA